MLVINADDIGRTQLDTDAALQCIHYGRVASLSAMLFMEDSERAAALLRNVNVPIGIHLNFTETFSARQLPPSLLACQRRVRSFLGAHKYAMVFYNPFRAADFRVLCEHQWCEFVHLYGRPPAHVDGHEHMHLCANVLFGRLIQPSQRVRRQQSFWPDRKVVLNNTYRGLIDKYLVRHYQTVDHCLQLAQYLHGNRMAMIGELARRQMVEVMAHPAIPAEYSYLMSDDCGRLLEELRTFECARV